MTWPADAPVNLKFRQYVYDNLLFAFEFAYTYVVRLFRKLCNYKKECHLGFASMSTNRQPLIYNPTNGGKERRTREARHTGYLIFS